MRRRAKRQKDLDEKAQKQAAEQRKKQQEEREFILRASDIANVVVRPATVPPPTNVRLRILRDNGRDAFEFTRVEAEKRLKSLLATASPEDIVSVRSAFSTLDTAVLNYAHKTDPARLPIRYVKYDRATGSLSIYSQLSPEATPEAIVTMPTDPSAQSLALVELRVFLRASGRVICYCASVPDAFRESSGYTGIEYVRAVEHSANTTPDLVLSAALLGERHFDPSRSELLDGLPSIRLGLLGLWDTWRMNLNFADRHEWRRFRQDIEFPSGVPSKPATARDVTEGLRRGEKDILLVLAHNDGNYIYLQSGEKLAFRDISELKREVSPNRVVVLITCRGASRQGGLASLAEMMLQNRLAKSVFASEDLIDARQLPTILQRLSSTPSLRSALHEFKFDQYVENRHDSYPGKLYHTGRVLRSRLLRA